MSRLTPPPDLVDHPLAVRKSMLKKSRSPWMIVLFGGIIALAAVFVLGLILNLFREEPPPPVFEHQVLMPDGTMLVVEAVTWGTSHDVPLSNMPPSSFFGGYVHNRAYHYTNENRLVVFMRRIDPATGQALDFTWWGSSAAVDAFGAEIPDSNPYQHVVYRYGNWSNGGYRPLEAPENQVAFDRRDPRSAIVAHSEFSAFRPDGDTFHLLVRDLEGKLVAEFDLPYPGPKPSEVWAPDPLPATQTVGAFALMLTDVSVVVSGNSWINNVQQFQYDMNPLAGEIFYDGISLGAVTPSIVSMTDPLGNMSDGYAVDLAWGEPAWKLLVNAYVPDWTNVPIGPSDSAEIGTITLPAAGSIVEVASAPTVNGRTISWRSLGAPGSTHQLGWLRSTEATVVSQDDLITINAEGSSYAIGGTNAYALVGIDPMQQWGFGPGLAEDIQLTTRDGAAISSYTYTYYGVVVTAFVPPEGVTEVVARYIVRPPVPTFEFLIAPPDHEPLPTPVVSPGGYSTMSPFYPAQPIPSVEQIVEEPPPMEGVPMTADEQTPAEESAVDETAPEDATTSEEEAIPSADASEVPE